MSALAAPAARRRFRVGEASVPALARGTQLRFDQSRGRWVMLVPERVLVPDDVAVEVLRLCDGVRRVEEIADVLAGSYAAPRAEILADITEMLQELVNSGFLIEAVEKQP
jgi:pyrroloquinoline quinone biosynthesis protein D